MVNAISSITECSRGGITIKPTSRTAWLAKYTFVYFSLYHLIQYLFLTQVNKLPWLPQISLDSLLENLMISQSLTVRQHIIMMLLVFLNNTKTLMILFLASWAYRKGVRAGLGSLVKRVSVLVFVISFINLVWPGIYLCGVEGIEGINRWWILRVSTSPHGWFEVPLFLALYLHLFRYGMSMEQKDLAWAKRSLLKLVILIFVLAAVESIFSPIVIGSLFREGIFIFS